MTDKDGFSMSDPTQQLPRTTTPRGPHAPTVLLGVACLLVAGLVIAYQVSGYTLAWDLAGPGVIIGAGALLLVLGLIGLMRRER